MDQEIYFTDDNVNKQIISKSHIPSRHNYSSQKLPFPLISKLHYHEGKLESTLLCYF